MASCVKISLPRAAGNDGESCFQTQVDAVSDAARRLATVFLTLHLISRDVPCGIFETKKEKGNEFREDVTEKPKPPHSHHLVFGVDYW